MKINLIDDTALVETTCNNKKERTILGRRDNANANVNDNNKKRSSRLHVCGNVRMNQENGCTERLKFQENGFHVDVCGNKKVAGSSSLKKQESEDVGFKNIQEIERKFGENVRACAGSSLKKQESFPQNQNQENERGMLGFDHEKNGKTIRVWLAKGKAEDKYDEVSTIEMVQLQSGIGSAKKTTISYSRKQMEDLRFVNIEDQNKNWGAIYCGLGPAGKREYDGLLDCKHPQQDLKKKVTAHRILGPMAVNGSWNHGYLCAPKNGLK